MRQIVSTLFPDPERAERAARALIDDGFGRADVSVVSAGVAPENDPYARVHGGPAGRRLERGRVSAKRGALLGLLAGAIAGIVIGFAGALLPYGYGVLTTVGWGLVIGAASGLVAGMILNANLRRVQHHHYPRPEVEGHTIVRLLTSEDRLERARELLERHDPLGFDSYAEDHDARRRVAEDTGAAAPGPPPA